MDTTVTYNVSNQLSLINLMTSVGLGAFLGIMVFIGVIIIVLVIAYWKIYEKCNKPGWAAALPFYNTWVLFEICGYKGWYSLIPFLNIIDAIMCNFKLAKVFNKGTGFGLGLLLLNPIFTCVLGFSSASPNKPEEVKESPNLMAPDPNANGSVNLMTPDPIMSIPTEQSPVPEVPEMTEAPSLETQMAPTPNIEPPVAPIVSNEITPVAPPVETVSAPVTDAFSMPMPKENETTIVNNNIMPETPAPVAPPVAPPAHVETLAPEPIVPETPETTNTGI